MSRRTHVRGTLVQYIRGEPATLIRPGSWPTPARRAACHILRCALVAEAWAPGRLVVSVTTFPVISLSRRVEAAVNERLGATRVHDDGGVDGITTDHIAVQTTMGVAGRPKVDSFVAGMRRHGLSRGLLVAPRFSLRLQRELDRLREHDHIEVRLVILVITSE
jgi:hypothetical protein